MTHHKPCKPRFIVNRDDVQKRVRDLADQYWLGPNPCPYRTYVCDQQRGFAKQKRCGCEYIVIPAWVIDEKNEGKLIHYICHEMAHFLAGLEHNHDEVFYQAMMAMCPPEFQHYDVTYKRRNARAAGVKCADGSTPRTDKEKYDQNRKGGRSIDI